jgi:prophage antirepressor-like protein
MSKETNIKLFEEKKVRSIWDEEKEEWYFSVIDIIEILTESANPRDYWFKMKQRVVLEDGIELSTICRQLKLTASDGKKYHTDCANVRSLFRIIQSIPSPKAEPFKQWLAKVGHERIQETTDPERSLDRARDNWQRLGRSEKWIQQRMTGQETRNKLTDYWKEAELIFTALAELSTRQIAESGKTKGFIENAAASKRGGKVAKNARNELEIETGKSVITGENFLPPKSQHTILPGL